MKRVLLTDMSGTGKSTLVETLKARGCTAVDLDQPGWSEYDAAGVGSREGIVMGGGTAVTGQFAHWHVNWIRHLIQFVDGSERMF
ncbi:MAG: hypothetical protein IPM53_27380 [Anaerolineaceae bacterium]|nr:hypothetical protein [Anaerolineaceae bacterium]